MAGVAMGGASEQPDRWAQVSTGQLCKPLAVSFSGLRLGSKRFPAFGGGFVLHVSRAGTWQGGLVPLTGHNAGPADTPLVSSV